MNTFADMYSTLPMFFMIFYLYIQRFDLFIMLIATDYLTNIIKQFTNLLPKNSILYSLSRRPYEGALCDYFSVVPCNKNAPGFPSGHMATTTYFFISILLLKYKTLKFAWILNKRLVFLCISGITTMGWVRYTKGCHTILQICAGSIVGICSSLFIRS